MPVPNSDRPRGIVQWVVFSLLLAFHGSLLAAQWLRERAGDVRSALAFRAALRRRRG